MHGECNTRGHLFVNVHNTVLIIECHGHVLDQSTIRHNVTSVDRLHTITFTFSSAHLSISLIVFQWHPYFNAAQSHE
jgi:hypothetical protein